MVMEESAHQVPTAATMYSTGVDFGPRDPYPRTPLMDADLVGICPECTSVHFLSELRSTLGPLAREYFCPSRGTEPLVRVVRTDEGWQYATSTEFLVRHRPAD